MKGFIYIIRNVVNGKVYVGQTVKEPSIRIGHHFVPSRKRVDLVSNAVQKYGRDALMPEVLCCAYNQEDLDFLERFFIRELNTLAPFGYNLRVGGRESCNMGTVARKNLSAALQGKKKSIEHRRRMSETRKGFTSENRRRAWNKVIQKMSKPVCAQELNGGPVFTFDSVEEAARQLNCVAGCISRVCRGDQNRTQHNGYMFWWSR